jgi:hypothetical protein
MQQQLNEAITPSELQFPKIEAIINFLLSQMTPYVQTNFASKEARLVTADNVIEVIEKLCLDNRALEATTPATPAAPAPQELFGKIVNVLSITATTLASTATTLGRAVGSPIAPAFIDPNQPFHRLQHLEYFACKAKQLRKLIADLRSFKFDSKLFNDTCDKLIEELTEFFEALRELRKTPDRVSLHLSCNGTHFNVTGMAGIIGGTSLGTSVAHILDNYKLSKITPEILKQKRPLRSHSHTSDEIENNQRRIRELELEVERLRTEDTVKAREVAKANDALSKALRSQEAIRIIALERDKDAATLQQLELQLNQALKNVPNPQEQARITREIVILREKISSQDRELDRLKQEMQSQKHSEEQQRNLLKLKLEAQNLANNKLASELAQAKADQLARESELKLNRAAQLTEEKAATQERDKLAFKLQTLAVELKNAQSNAADPQEKDRISHAINELNGQLAAKNSELAKFTQQLQQRESEAKQLAKHIQQLTDQQRQALEAHDQLAQALAQANAREMTLKQSYEEMQQTHQRQLAEAKARETAQQREKTQMLLQFKKEIEERKAMLVAQEQQTNEMQQALLREQKNHQASAEAQELRTQKMQSDHQRELEKTREMQTQELEKIRAIQLAQEQELTAAREQQLTQARELREANEAKLALEQKGEIVNQHDDKGFNLLHTAIKLNNPKSVAAVLTMSANANIKSRDGRSPLCLALVHDDGTGMSLKKEKDLNADTINIVGQLLKHNAIVNEPVTPLNRNFVHFLIFTSKKLLKLEDPQLRSSPNLELIKLFLLHGCDVNSCDPRCGKDIGTFIARKDLNVTQQKARDILLTFRNYCVSELSTTINWRHEFLDRYQKLSDRKEESETANKHMIKIRPFFERYSFIFDLFVMTNDREKNIAKAKELVKMVSAQQMSEDIDKLGAHLIESQGWLNKQPKSQARAIDTIFILDSPELARENQLFLQTIVQNLIKCIQKAEVMHKPRWFEKQGEYVSESCILTPLEAKVIEINLPQALEMFKENLEKKRIYEEKQAASIVKK